MHFSFFRTHEWALQVPSSDSSSSSRQYIETTDAYGIRFQFVTLPRFVFLYVEMFVHSETFADVHFGTPSHDRSRSNAFALSTCPLPSKVMRFDEFKSMTALFDMIVFFHIMKYRYGSVFILTLWLDVQQLIFF